ncbi:nuclear transport factor 2 family protein [Nocardioides ginsengisoli]|uniref:Nuclear transport factor 2 family protein n=1 Tax=Nocardioides ginsengisoli TaxID=363868 RepID=A0ABW3VY01_9ACTN
MTIDIPATVARYLARVADAASGADIAALYADHGTLEDPVGSPALKGTGEIAAFYDALAGLERRTELLALRVSGNEAAFSFRVVTGSGAEQATIEPIDVMTFDEEGRITSMRAFWSPADVRIG